jgi:hypothetical protein
VSLERTATQESASMGSAMSDLPAPRCDRSRAGTLTRTACALLVAATLACSTQMGRLPSLSQESDAFEEFVAGRARLTCGILCAGARTWNNENINRTYYDRAWKRLALEVLRIGHSQDLDYYFLGRAAQGLGLPTVAATYYEIASKKNDSWGDRSTTPSYACIPAPDEWAAPLRRTIGGCANLLSDGSSIPRMAVARIQRIQQGKSELAAVGNMVPPTPAPLLARRKPPTPLSRRIAVDDQAAPEITSPLEVAAGSKNGTATLRGRVTDLSPIASFSVDGDQLQLGDGGSFEYRRYLQRGQSLELQIVAIDQYGNRATRTVTATRSAQAPVEAVQFKPLDPSRSLAGRRKDQALALVIGVENYKRMPEALYARTDANVFQDYVRRVLGVPQGRILSLLDSDADHFGIQDAVRRLRGLVDAKTDLYVYFAGHGFASGEGIPYLLPHDGDAHFLNQLVSRNDLFESLADLGARSVTVFLDTCYSGRSRTGTVLAKGMRPLVVASSNEGVPAGFTVISAAASDEFSGDLPEAEHGLFSYYLMRGLGGEADRDGDRAITVEELHGYIAGEVSRQAARLGREQTPEIFGERNRVLVRY